MCCHGIDMATRAEPIGADLTEQEICDFDAVTQAREGRPVA